MAMLVGTIVMVLVHPEIVMVAIINDTMILLQELMILVRVTMQLRLQDFISLQDL